MNKKRNRGTVVLIAFLVSLAVVALIWGTTVALNTTNTQYVELPVIKTSVASGKDGQQHNLEAKFSVEIKKGAAKVDPDVLNSRINAVITSLDYDMITGENGTTYIKDAIRANLSDLVSEKDLEAIYISDVVSDFTLPASNQPKERKSKVLKSLFPNMK